MNKTANFEKKKTLGTSLTIDLFRSNQAGLEKYFLKREKAC